MSPLVLFASSCLRGGVEEPTDAQSILEGQVVLQAGRALVGEDEAPLGLHGLEAMTTVWAEGCLCESKPSSSLEVRLQGGQQKEGEKQEQE